MPEQINLPTYEQSKTLINAVSKIDWTAIGTPNSAASSVTSANAHAKLNFITTNLNSNNINTVAINNNLGTPTSTSSNTPSANAHAKLNFLLNDIKPAVKNVQRGTANIGANTFQTDVFISTVNTSKTFLDVKSLRENTVITLINSNTIRISRFGEFSSSAIEAFWQLVEYN